MPVGVKRIHTLSPPGGRSRKSATMHPPERRVALEREAPPEPVNIQDTIEYSYYERIRPLHTIQDQEPVTFVEVSDSVHALDLSQSLLKIKLKVVKGDNTILTAGQSTSIINFITNTLWSRAEAYLNECKISDHNMYWASSYMDALLNIPEVIKEEQLGAAGYFADTNGKFDTRTLADDGNGNAGFISRNGLVKLSTLTTFCGSLHLDVFKLERLIPAGVKLRLNLFPNPTTFTVMTSETDVPKLVLEDAELYLKKVKLTPDSQLRISKALSLAPAVFPMRKTEVRSHLLANATTAFNLDNFLVQEILPHTITIAFVDTAAVTGDYARNPLLFGKNTLNQFRLIVNNQRIPAMGDNDIEIFDYLALYGGERGPFRSPPIGLSPNKISAGYYILQFRIAPSTASYISEQRSGRVAIEGHFETPLPRGLTMLAFLEYHASMSIDENRQVTRTP